MFPNLQTANFVATDQPPPRSRALVDTVVESNTRTLKVSYSHTGPPGIAPARLLRALLLQILYLIRTERQFVEQYFCVDGTLIEGWALMGSYRSKNDDSGPPSGPPAFKNEAWCAATHECETDPDVLLYKKALGQRSCLCYIGHTLTDNRHVLVSDRGTAQATGTAQVDAALTMFNRRPGKRRLTVGADKYYHQQCFLQGARRARVKLNVAPNTRGRRTTIAPVTTNAPVTHSRLTHVVRSRCRLARASSLGRYKPMLRGLAWIDAQAKLAFVSYNLMRFAALEAT